MIIQNIPPIIGFPVPVLPQAFDESLSYYELLCKLTETVNTCIVGINALNAAVSGFDVRITALETQMQSVGDVDAKIAAAVGTEAETRVQEISSLAGDLASFKNIVFTTYATYQDIENYYLLGDITFQLLTQAEYDSLTAYVAKRVYFIWDGTNIVIRYHNTTNDTGTRLAFNSSATGLFNPELRGIVNGGIFNFIPESEDR